MCSSFERFLEQILIIPLKLLEKLACKVKLYYFYFQRTSKWMFSLSANTFLKFSRYFAEQ